MTEEIKEASIGEYIQAEDLLNSPIKLRIVGSELQKDKVEANSGKMMDKIIFFLEDNKGNSREIGVLSFDSLVRQMNTADPNIGDILQLETIEVTGSKYLIWKVEVVKKATGDIPAKKIEAGEVEKEKLPADTTKATGEMTKEEEKELLANIPF